MHETCVVSMADGHARVTGRPQLAQVSTLPGSANSVGALYDAYRDRSPGIVTSTNVDTSIAEPTLLTPLAAPRRTRLAPTADISAGGADFRGESRSGTLARFAAHRR